MEFEAIVFILIISEYYYDFQPYRTNELDFENINFISQNISEKVDIDWQNTQNFQLNAQLFQTFYISVSKQHF